MNKTFFAIPGLIMALSASALAAPSWEEQSMRTALAASDSAPAATAGVKITGVREGLRVPAGSPGFLTNFVATGPIESGVPCFGCVNGAPQDALGLPGPFNYVPTGNGQQYDVSWTNLTYKGSCKVSVVVASGKTVIYKTSFTVPNISGAGTLLIGFNSPAQNFSGAAIVTGKVACGGKSSVATAPIIFQ